MAKGKSIVFFCSSCGSEFSKWSGQCPVCKEWNTLVEEPSAAALPNQAGAAKRSGDLPRPQPLSEVPLSEQMRTSTGLFEFDRVLGGGLVPGSLILVGGDPGIGKSTLLLQACKNLTDGGQSVLYVSGEESLQQIRLRASRIGSFSDRLLLLSETDLDDIVEVINKYRPQTVVIDSIQTMVNPSLPSSPGSVSQVRESTGVLLQLAKGRNVSIFIVGHVTKEGMVAGPRILEHMVDTVLYFEGEENASYRILRSAKNRFGSTNEIGVFEMRRKGLCEVKNPSAFMLDGRPVGVSGSVVACSMEGTRPILVEVQALVCKSTFGNPRRTAIGTDVNRLNLLMAVLEKRLGLALAQCDAYVNITGGIRMSEPAMDLPLVLAILSGYLDQPIDGQLVCFGEVGLSGEVRGVGMAQQRLDEAAKLGFTSVLMPSVCRRSIPDRTDLTLHGVENVKEALSLICPGSGREKQT